MNFSDWKDEDISWDDIASTPEWATAEEIQQQNIDVEFYGITHFNYSQSEVNALENWAQEIEALWETGL